MQNGRLFVFSGPSGAGKGTICDELVKLGLGKLSISMTTRAIRGAEIPNVSYYYVSDEEFDKTIKEDGFLEYAGIYDHRYGTPKKPVLDAMEKGQDVILEIEMQGALQVKKNYPDAVLIFVLPPSLKILAERLAKRNTDSKAQIIKRTEATLSEIHRIKEYDYFVINDELSNAVTSAKAIMAYEHGDENAKKIAYNWKVTEEAIAMTHKYDEEAGK